VRTRGEYRDFDKASVDRIEVQVQTRYKWRKALRDRIELPALAATLSRRGFLGDRADLRRCLDTMRCYSRIECLLLEPKMHKANGRLNGQTEWLRAGLGGRYPQMRGAC
jgi:hypothetical protein